MDIKYFNKYPTNNIEVKDLGLKDFISLQPRFLPLTEGRHSKYRFYKSKIPIIERLINRMMVAGHKGKKHKYSSGHNTGKKYNSYSIVKKAFEIVEKKTKKNPVEVFVRAIENAAPKEEITAIEYGGARYPKAVDCSPQRRVDLAIKHISQGVYSKSFNSKKTAVNALAEEIIAAYNNDSASESIKKRIEIERQAESSR